MNDRITQHSATMTPVQAELEEVATGCDPAGGSTITSRERRHRIILGLLRQNGKVTFGDIEKYVALAGSKIRNVSRRSFYDDIDQLRYVTGLKITPVKSPDNHLTYVLESSQRPTTKEQRFSANPEKKEVIAALCAGLLLGTNEEDPRLVIQPYKRSKIESFVNTQTGTAQGHAAKLIADLHSLVWSTTQRRIAMDTGTTLELFAKEILAKLEIPSEHLNRLYVCTNSRGMFDILGHPSVPVKAIMVGGIQHPQTEAVVGWLAETFLTATNLKFAMSFVGATAVDTKDFTFGADQEQDSGIKNEFISRAEIRVIVADSSKWGPGKCSSFFPFCRIDSGAIGLVVTDRISNGNLERVNARGVPVLAAEYYAKDDDEKDSK
jgi:DeoR/GlpR family transcriptional regulator of sugar metabolism